jgi:hypothetical protein
MGLGLREGIERVHTFSSFSILFLCPLFSANEELVKRIRSEREKSE